MLTRHASSPLNSAADRSSSSITYIFISKDCFIRNADVLAFHCAISVFQTIQELHFTKADIYILYSQIPENESFLVMYDLTVL